MLWVEVLRMSFPPPRIQHGRSDNWACLRTLVRFYITIIDGECQVERDLGRMSAELQEHCNIHGEGINDLMLLLSRGPRAREDWVRESKTTPFAQACVRLWRQHFGARLGIGGGKRQPKAEKKTWKRVPLKVGWAAKGAVRANKAGLTARPVLSTLFGGLTRQDLRAGPVDPQRKELLFTDKHKKFEEDTKNKRVSSAARLQVVLQGRGLQSRPQEKRAAPVQSDNQLGAVRQVCFADFPAGEVPSHGAYEVSFAREADLVVVPNLSVLLEPKASFLPALCFIVLCGLPVVTKAVWVKARARTTNIPSRSVLSHEPAAAKRERHLYMTSELATEESRIAKALQRACRRHGQIAITICEPPAASISFTSLENVTSWLRAERRVVNFAGRARVLAVDGEPLC